MNCEFREKNFSTKGNLIILSNFYIKIFSTHTQYNLCL
jgi:hypothetical protein